MFEAKKSQFFQNLPPPPILHRKNAGPAKKCNSIACSNRTSNDCGCCSNCCPCKNG